MTGRRLMTALVITLAFVGLEAAAGLAANSLALLTDAAHNVTDVLALALSWHALRLAARPSSSSKTYGYHRAGILIALFNSTTLVVIALGIFYEAITRLMHPPEVQEMLLIGVGAVAFVVNLGTALIVRGGNRQDINVRSAFVHLASDAASTLDAVVAGVVIYFTGWYALDAVVSLLIGGLIVWNGWQIIRETVVILMEQTPREIDMSELVHDIEHVEGVRGVHDVHAWSITQEMRAFSAHVLTDDIPISAGAQIQHAINEMLAHRYGIGHATLQLECEGCEPDRLYCGMENHEHHPAPEPALDQPSPQALR
jgi:cobalt-zinc-cadmium efflux system protein